MECIIYKNKKDGVSILYPICSSELTLEMIAAKDVPSGVEYKIIKKDTLPEDRTFRDAWSIEDWSVVIKMDKAKEIWKNQWRKARKSKLETLDVEFMRAIESGNISDQEEIKAKKQTLRDVTSVDLTSASSVEELKAVWPDCLK